MSLNFKKTSSNISYECLVENVYHLFYGSYCYLSKPMNMYTKKKTKQRRTIIDINNHRKLKMDAIKHCTELECYQGTNRTVPAPHVKPALVLGYQY